MYPEINVYTVLVTSAVVLLYFYLTRNFKYWKDRNISYITPKLLFGNAFQVFMQKIAMGDFLQNLHNYTSSPYLGFFIFDKPFLLIRDTEVIRTCLVKDFDYFPDRSVLENRRDDILSSNMLFLLKSPSWKSIRAKLTPVFTSGKIRKMLPLITDVGNDLLNHVREISLKKDAVDVREMAMKYTTDVISSCAFGIKADCFKHVNAEFRVLTRRIFDMTIAKIQMACYFFAPMLVKLLRLKFIDKDSAQFMKDAFLNTMVARKKSEAYRGDLVDILVKLQEQSPDLFDDDMVVAQAIQFFIAGFETTGSTTAFALYELALNPEIQDRVRSDILDIKNKHEELTYEAIQEMNYLDMVCNEALRKYPVLPYLDRECIQNYKIPGTDIIIEKGVPIYISILGLHYDPQYFPNPEEFNPENFSAANKSSRAAYCYLPFGEGPRACIGRRFAMISMKSALVRLLSEFEIEVSGDHPINNGKFSKQGFLLAPETTLNVKFKPIG